jgi:hypothetical protein
MTRYVFDIPVYRCTESAFVKERMKERERRLRGFDKLETPHAYDAVERHIEEEWYPWELNEIVGYLRLYVHGHRVKGDLFYMKSKHKGRTRRIGRGSKDPIVYYAKIFELPFSPTDTSQTVYQSLMHDLQRLKHPPLNRRYLNLKDFSRFGMHIDWSKLADGT